MGWDDDGTIPGALPAELGPTWLKDARSAGQAQKAPPPPPRAPAAPAGEEAPKTTIGQLLSGAPGAARPASSPPPPAPQDEPTRTIPRAARAAAHKPFQMVWLDAEGASAVLAGRDRGDGDGGPLVASIGALMATDPRPLLTELGALYAPAVGPGHAEQVFAVLSGVLAPEPSRAARLGILADALQHLGPAGERDPEVAEALERARAAAAEQCTIPEILDDLSDALLAALPVATRERAQRIAASEILRGRAFETRQVLGGEHVLCSLSRLEGTVPAYLPVEATPLLPIRSSFEAVVLAEVLPSQDESDACELCVRIVALGRTLTFL